MNISCEKTGTIAFELASRRVDTEEREALLAHIEQCVSCRAALGWAHQVVGVVEEMQQAPFAKEAQERALQGLQATMVRERPGRRRRGGWTGWTTAFAMTAAAGVAVVVWLQVKAPTAPPSGDRVVAAKGPQPSPQTAQLQPQLLRQMGQLQIGESDRDDMLRAIKKAPNISPLGVGGRLRTQAGGQIELALGADVLTVLEQSAVRLLELAPRTTELALEQGVVVLDVAPAEPSPARAGPRRQVVVRAPFGAVRVKGTRFRVSDKDGGEVATLSGVVEVQLDRPGAPVHRVAAGQWLSVRDQKVISLAAEQSAELRGQLDKPWLEAARSSDHGALDITGSPTGATVFLDGVAAGQTPLYIRWPAGEVRYRIAGGKDHVERVGELTLAGAAVERIEYALAEAQPPAARSRRARRRSQPAPKALEVGARERLAALHAAGNCTGMLDFAKGEKGLSAHARAEALSLTAQCYQTRRLYPRALTVYGQIRSRYRTTPTAEIALFETGRLSEKLGRLTAARRAFDDYRRRYPDGPLAGDALFRLCRIAMRGERYTAAAACLQRYRLEYAQGKRWADSLFLEALVEKNGRRNLSAAAALFRRYLAQQEQDNAEAALYWYAYCVGQVDPTRLEAAARAYLERFPHGSHAKEVRRWLKR